MDRQRIADGADRFAAYIEERTGGIGEADRAAPLRDYCTGLLAAEGRESVEPMAAVAAPGRVSVQHQKLLHFIGEGTWSGERVLAKVRELVVPKIERHGPIKAWIVDDTGFPKQAAIRSASIISIAGSLASRPMVRACPREAGCEKTLMLFFKVEFSLQF